MDTGVGVYCFEMLVAALDEKEPMNLDDFLSSWGEWLHSQSQPSSSSSQSQPPLITTVNGSMETSRPAEVSAFIDRECPLFVTWNTCRSRSGRVLRGCIGTFENQQMGYGLSNYALIAAFDDTRFDPISRRELPVLECSVTLLTNFEPAADIYDWQLGVHGVRLAFEADRKTYSATYLPDVPEDQGWTQDETLQSLVKKAGWKGRTEAWKRIPNLQLTRYQGKKYRATYQHFRDWKEWTTRPGLNGVR